MKLAERNYMWVRDHAFAIGEKKKGIAAFVFSVGEVQKTLGFSRNTVQKYVDMLQEDGVIRPVQLTDTWTVYKFNRSYLEGITGDRLSTGKGFQS